MKGERERLLGQHFSDFLANRCGLEAAERDRFKALVLSLTQAMESGHSCLEIKEADVQFLLRSPLVSQADSTPLVVYQGRLYLHRYHRYESRLAKQLSDMTEYDAELEADPECVDLLFPAQTNGQDYQRSAAELALRKQLCIISGGPGTGKTTTVVKILALLLSASGRALRVALAAPTGKAAMRLQESVGKSVGALSLPDPIRERIPLVATTLHRLLGVRRNSPQFRHSAEQPMSWDVVIIDEASMVDLAMMSKLVDALKPGARLVLLGDKDQLASVESGAVLLDCIRSLPRHTVELKKSYRFDKGIRKLAETINRGDGEACWRLLDTDDVANVTLVRNSYFDSIGARYAAYMKVVHEVGSATPEALDRVFAAFNSFKVLCATRHGAGGLVRVNDQVEKYLKMEGYRVNPGTWYSGRPVMITANDYTLGLYNGDVGVCLPDPETGTMKVWFERGDGGFRSCQLHRIPRCETVFAMTIHKSQGSEFREVMVILPEEENLILNRQLVYTAVTRAKEFVQIVASKKILVYALQSDYPRSSGLSLILQKTGRESTN